MTLTIKVIRNEKTSPTMAVPEGALIVIERGSVNSKQWGFHDFFYIWYRLLCMLFEDTNINVHALIVRFPVL